jgi:ABC-type antimicrobial peptide transport system permease subunit
VVRHIDRNGDTDEDEATPLILGKRLRNDFPQLEKSALTIYEGGGTFIVDPDKQMDTPKKLRFKKGITYADPEFYEIFNFPWLLGDYKKVLSEPNSAALTESAAKKLFGVNNGDYAGILGRSLKLNNNLLITVKGIIKDIPANTDLPFEAVISSVTHYNNSDKEDYETWNHSSSTVNYYVLLREGVTKKDFEDRLEEMSQKELPQLNNIKTGFKLQPLSDIHFSSILNNYNYRTINKNSLLALGIIAGLLILAACINFINLATAQAVKRSKEVGIKKTLGAGNASLFSYFMWETAIIVFSSALLSIVVAEIFAARIFNLLNVELEYHSLADYQALGFLAGLSIVTAVIAGSYPALLMAKSAPIKAMKGGLSGGSNSKGLFLRRSLVVTQFVISQGLIIGALVIGGQINLFKNKDIGYDKDLIVITTLPEGGYKQSRYLREQFSALPNVKSVTVSLNPPSGVTGRWGTVLYPADNPNLPIRTDMKVADENFIKTYNLKLLAGREITEADGFDNVIINEAMMRKAGIKSPDEAIGYTFAYDDSVKLHVAGVVKDFYLRSLLQGSIEPMMIFNAKGDLEELFYTVGIKLKEYGSKNEMQETVAGIQKIWEAAFPTEIFDYSYLDEYLFQYYRNEERMSNIILSFTLIAVLIGCIGLYGLISFIAAQKTKEIGVRKVLGASTAGIVGLLSKEFLVLIGISFVITWPLSYYLMSKWLEGYPNRISLGPWIFALAAFITLAIAALTISYQAVKAATANPVKSLKYE